MDFQSMKMLNVLSKWFSKCPGLLYRIRSHDRDKNKIEDRDIPRSMRNELAYLAKCKGENKGLNPLMNEMEGLMNEKIPTWISQIQVLGESLQTELKYAWHCSRQHC